MYLVLKPLFSLTKSMQKYLDKQKKVYENDMKEKRSVCMCFSLMQYSYF